MISFPLPAARRYPVLSHTHGDPHMTWGKLTMSPTSSQMWNPIPWRVTEAKWAGDQILVNDRRGERCQGLWGRFPLFGFFLSGLVARNGRYGKNLCLIGALELLIALCLPFNPSWTSSDIRL